MMAGLVLAMVIGTIADARGDDATTSARPTTIRQVAAFLPFQDETPPVTADAAAPATAGETAAAATALNTIAAVTSAMEQVTADVSIDPMLKTRLLETLASIQAELKNRQADADRLAAIDEQVSKMAVAVAKARAAAAETMEAKPINGRGMGIERVSEKRTSANNELIAAQEKLQRIDGEIAKRKERIEKLPTEIAAARKLAEQLKEQSVGEITDDPDGRLKAALKAALAARVSAAEERVKLLGREQALYEAQTELLPLQRTAQEKIVAAEEATFRAWSAELRRRRESQIKSDLEQFKTELAEKSIDPSASMILRLEDRWITTVGETERIDRQLTIEKAKTIELIEQFAEQSKAITQKISESGGLPSSLGLKLQLLKSKLPSLASTRDQIAAVNDQLEQTRQLQTELELILEGVQLDSRGGMPVSNLPVMAEITKPISDSETVLIEKLRSDLGSHQNRLLELQTELETQRVTTAKLLTLIDTNVVWIKNQPTFRATDLFAAWDAFRWILQPSNLMMLSTRMMDGFVRRWELAVIAIVCVLAMLFSGARLRRRITTLGEKARSRQSVSLRPTFAATLLSWALVLPIVTLLYVLGEALTAAGTSEPLVRAAAKALRLSSLVVLPIEFLRQCLRKNGLAVAHFEADESSLVAVRRWLRVMIDIGLPLLLFFVIAENLGRSPSAIALSQVALAAGMALVSVVLWRTFEPTNGIFSARIRSAPDSWLARLRHVWFVPIALAPIALTIVSLLGFGTAAKILIERLYWTLWLCLLAYYVGGLVRRWLLTQRRRLTMAVHRERLEESERLGVGGVDVEPSSSMAASEINAQTTRLIQTFLFIAALIGVAWIWAPVLPAVKYLEGVTLWSTTDGKGELVPITLASLVITIPVIVLTWASVRNLPGLVEGVLLERLPLDKPARYAITTLGTYALGIMGIMIASQTLGVRWDSIQWLVAALGVGLGFGLQEIFANFISGLILLFEQPIRIGDVVTLGDTTGVVAKIRMRATTVTNWDRQELIIPNKDLITGRLVNWTLTDSTNRIVLNVGIAYGSDTEAACDRLRAICQEHDNIADDPAPLVTFEGFGDSTLNLVLRCFLATLDNRLQTIHELHTRINQQFNAAGIEIAFPQRDLHLRTLPPELMRHLAGGAAKQDSSAN